MATDAYSCDIVLLFLTRALRMFSYGMISVIFINHLLTKGLLEDEIGWLQSSIVFGDIFVSIVLTTKADVIGRKRVLLLGGLIKCTTGLVFALSKNWWFLLVSGVFGIISVTGGEIGPFLPIEQSSLTQILQNRLSSPKALSRQTTRYLGYYNLVGYTSQALGALFAGFYMSNIGPYLEFSSSECMEHIFQIYGLLGFMKAVGYGFLNKDHIQPTKVVNKAILNFAGLTSESVRPITKLSILFTIDAMAGGLVAQSFISYYFKAKFDLSYQNLGSAIFVCNVVAGISGVLSARLVGKIGAVQTMIVTHLPSNILLILVGLSQDSGSTALFWLIARFCISQMDVPARQAYVSLVVSNEERSAANGITNIVRSIGVCIGLALVGIFMDADPKSLAFSYPFFIAGGMKIIYDVTLGLCFLTSSGKDKPRMQKIEQIEEIEAEELSDRKIVLTK